MNTKVLVTGGAGFIGSNLVHSLIDETSADVTVLDALTYAGNPDNLAEIPAGGRYRFVHGDICNATLVAEVMEEFQPDVVFHLAAESHVDRSIDGPREFARTNVMGTLELLEGARKLWTRSSGDKKTAFRFVHISTDEVYGSLGETGLFTEETAYAPNSPYAASKAGSDHLVRAYFHTYGMPVLTTNCSNNYGPYQFPEKLIPLVTLNALEGKALPVYGDGENVRDWLFVKDHCRALMTVAHHGVPGSTYNVGGNCERTTLQIVQAVCDALDQLSPPATNPQISVSGLKLGSYRDLIQFVKDRPGHDRRYAIDAAKISRELGWKPTVGFGEGIKHTVEWYLQHREWCARITSGTYRRERLGLGGSEK